MGRMRVRACVREWAGMGVRALGWMWVRACVRMGVGECVRG